jgi:hypothetical protein
MSLITKGRQVDIGFSSAGAELGERRRPMRVNTRILTRLKIPYLPVMRFFVCNIIFCFTVRKPTVQKNMVQNFFKCLPSRTDSCPVASTVHVSDLITQSFAKSFFSFLGFHMDGKFVLEMDMNYRTQKKLMFISRIALKSLHITISNIENR